MSNPETDFGIHTYPNPGRELYKEHNSLRYARYPVGTRLVQLGDSYLEVIEKYARPHLQPGDFLVCSEKFIGICQRRVVHQSEVKATWLAKLICRFVTKYPNDVGFENPLKMQVAINEAGYPRMIAAVILGGLMKYIFRQRGWFYIIAGNQIAAIDGFNPIAIPPFNEYATLAPANPDGVCNEIEEKIGVPAVIVDASNVATNILGRSKGVGEKLQLSDTDLIGIVEGNPMGQSREQTPVLIIRKG
jgi:F420-0:gamma-glutamyl ligase-like protein